MKIRCLKNQDYRARALQTFIVTTAISIFMSSLNSQKANAAEGVSKSFYDPHAVVELTLKTAHQSVTVRKNASGVWVRSGLKNNKRAPVDAWSVQRRLTSLARFTPERSASETLINKIGTIEVKTLEAGSRTREKTFKGIYNDEIFQWTHEGAEKPEGFSLKDKPELAALFNEGVQGLDSHTLNLCNAENVQSLMVAPEWTLVRRPHREWLVKTLDGAENPARAKVVESTLKKFCVVKVDTFISNSHSDNEIIEIVQSGQKEPLVISNSSGFYFITHIGAFTSTALDALVHLSLTTFQDPSLKLGQIATDPKKSVAERLDALHKLKAEASPYALTALKNIINENTDIDVFRFEAVEALQTIGTPDAINIIADRLALTNPAGFELKLARALSGAMRVNFLSNEKSPEGERHIEVRKLLETYRKNQGRTERAESLTNER